MKLHQIAPQDNKRRTMLPITLAELKALHNALAVDLATGGGTSPGVDLAALQQKVKRLISQAEPPVA